MDMDIPSSVLKTVSMAITAKPPQGVVGTIKKSSKGGPTHKSHGTLLYVCSFWKESVR